jgi:uncharacterized protein (TIGR00661 family)
LKFIFIVQGEGRGHLTQAISLYHLLTQAGHNVPAVLIGKSERRQIPPFVYEKITSPIHLFESPNFVADAKNKSIQLLPTIFYNLRRIPLYLRHLRFIHQIITAEKPDVIVNFYDFLGGFYGFFYRSEGIRIAVVGHQFYLEHSTFRFPKGDATRKFLLRLNNKVTAGGCDKKLALSLRKAADEPGKKIHIVPPLLRQEVRELTPEIQPFILAYLNMQGYAEELIDWHKEHTSVVVHAFCDLKDRPDPWQPQENLTFHRINDRLFLEMMRTCRAYATNAGFESVCEAMYLGKPVLLVPIAGQFEQVCNAADALQSGAGITADYFDLSLLQNYLPDHKPVTGFREWVEQAEILFLRELTEW